MDILEKIILKNEDLLHKQEDKTFYLFEILNGDSSRIKPTFEILGYLDLYGSYYSDSNNVEYQKFPTSAPRANQFGINMFYLGLNYHNKKVAAKIGLHMGDIPASAWSAKLNLIQEANISYMLNKKVFVEAGLFRTHIGIESIQPRENITISLASTTYFDPYFLSGIKLNYKLNSKLLLQANLFNGFNTFVENNNNKAVGLVTNIECKPMLILE